MHVGVHVASFPADESLIYFDFGTKMPASQLHSGSGLHGEPDSMEHEPCGLLSDSESASYFVGANAIFAVGDHPHCDKPLVERKRRILKDSPDLCRELPFGMLALALPYPASGKEANVFALAGGAFDTVGPAARNDELDAVIGIGEVNDGLL